MSGQVPKEMSAFIKGNGIMTLAVCDKEPWICTVYYGTDDALNFYLVTDPDSIHGKILENNSKAAFNIFDSHTKITESKKGIQGRGICTIVKSLGETVKGLMIWHKANPGVESQITIENIKKFKDTKIYKIKPTYLKFFNKDLYGKDEYGFWEL